MAEEHPKNLDYDGGFLSTSQREYLAENTDKTLDGYSNPSVWWDRVRTRYEGALMDMALLGSYTGTNEDRVKEIRQSAQQKLSNIGWRYKEDAPLAGIHGATALAETYDNGELMRLIHPMKSVAQEVREEREMTQKFLVKAIIRVLKNGDPDDDEIIEFLNKYWPDRDRVVELAERELSAD